MTAEDVLDEIRGVDDDMRLMRERLVHLRARKLELFKEYAQKRPLTEVERDTMAKMVEKGDALCCGPGLDRLKALGLPEIWALSINSWAYAKTGCSNRPDRTLSEWAARVRALKLDELPKGYETDDE